jgi:hypothetical protein
MIATERLELIPATVESARAALDGEPALAAHLAVVVPATWPPEFLDPPLEFTLRGSRRVHSRLDGGFTSSSSPAAQPAEP